MQVNCKYCGQEKMQGYLCPDCGLNFENDDDYKEKMKKITHDQIAYEDRKGCFYEGW